MKQSSKIEVNLSHEPVEIYIDGYVKNPLTKIDFSLYRNASSYYLKGFDLSEDWTEVDGHEIEELFEGSLMMDYDKPEVYLNLLLEDDNKMIAREEDDKIMITVTDPTEPTRRAIAQYLIDSVRETADEDKNLEALSITVSNMVIVLDADTKLVRSISMDQSAQLQDDDKSGMSVDQKLTVTYDQVDEAKMKLPDDLLEMIG